MNLGRVSPSVVRAALPLLTIFGSMIAAFAFGIEIALLIVASGALIGVVALLWASVQSLTGEAPITLEEALDLYDVRAGLARVAGRLAASRLAATEESKLVETMDSMRKALAERDGARYNTLNGTLHNMMMNAAKNARLLEINAGVEDELSLYLHKGAYSNSQMQRSLEEHQRMVDAVCNGRVAEAAEAFEAHIVAGKQRMLDTVSQSSGR